MTSLCMLTIVVQALLPDTSVSLATTEPVRFEGKLQWPPALWPGLEGSKIAKCHFINWILSDM